MTFEVGQRVRFIENGQRGKVTRIDDNFVWVVFDSPGSSAASERGRGGEGPPERLRHSEIAPDPS